MAEEVDAYAMPPVPDGKPTRTYWVVSTLLLLWGVGYAALVMEEFLVYKPEDFDRLVRAGVILPGYSDYLQHLPGWVIGIAVFKAVTRLAGAVGLLLRKRWSITMYCLSFAASSMIFFRGFLLENVAAFEPPTQIGLEAVFFALGIYAVWFAVQAFFRNILK